MDKLSVLFFELDKGHQQCQSVFKQIKNLTTEVANSNAIAVINDTFIKIAVHALHNPEVREALGVFINTRFEREATILLANYELISREEKGQKSIFLVKPTYNASNEESIFSELKKVLQKMPA